MKLRCSYVEAALPREDAEVSERIPGFPLMCMQKAGIKKAHTRVYTEAHFAFQFKMILTVKGLK